MSYEMKKSLRKSTGPSKSYVEQEEEKQANNIEDIKNNSQKEVQK